MQAQDIQDEYRCRLAHGSEDWGWSFAYTPVARIETAKVVQIALNPRGDLKNAPEYNWEYTGGKDQNAFVDELSWRDGDQLNDLQKQIQCLYSALGVDAGDVFAANFVPFTSPTWEKLHDKEGAREFSRRLWGELLPQAREARVFVVLGEEPRLELVSKEFRPLIGLADGVQPVWHDFGWKRRWIGEYDLAEGRKLLTLPHLSRNQIFSGDKTRAAEVVSEIAKRAKLQSVAPFD